MQIAKGTHGPRERLPGGNVDSPRILFALVAASALFFGCGPLGTGGELSHGGFSYRCTSEGDPTCDVPDWEYALAELPDTLAVGSRFGIEYSGQSAETESGASYAVTVVPASTYMAERSGSELVVKAPGHVALLAVAAGSVADFVHIRAASPTVIVLEESGAAVVAPTLAAGSSTSLRATLADADGQLLGGGASYTWTSSDEAVLLVGSSYGDNDATWTAVAPGVATVSVSALGLTRDFPVIVEVAP
jgi:hypothetical protein